MITLYTFGPMFGLPDPSPFVSKGIVLLRMSGLEHRVVGGDLRKAPKGKLPYMDDDGTVIADSTFMRWHLEERHGVELDRGLGPEQKGIAWAAEKLCEDNLYWSILGSRWMLDVNFDKGPRRYFDSVPTPVRPLVIAMVRRQVRRSMHGHGMGRHTQAEIDRLAGAALDAIAGILGDKPWLVGSEPCGADASVWSFVSGTLCDHFPGPQRDHALRHANLVAYCDRGFARWFPGGVAA